MNLTTFNKEIAPSMYEEAETSNLNSLSKPFIFDGKEYIADLERFFDNNEFHHDEISYKDAN